MSPRKLFDDATTARIVERLATDMLAQPADERDAFVADVIKGYAGKVMRERPDATADEVKAHMRDVLLGMDALVQRRALESGKPAGSA